MHKLSKFSIFNNEVWQSTPNSKIFNDGIDDEDLTRMASVILLRFKLKCLAKGQLKLWASFSAAVAISHIPTNGMFSHSD